MGITSNTTPLSRFSVEGHAPSADFEDWVAARLPQHGFENIDEGPEPAALRITWLPVDGPGLEVQHRDIPNFSTAQEPSLVLLPDGRLFVVMRTLEGHVWYSVSDDDGATWRPTEVLRFRDGGEPVKHPLSCCPIYPLDGGRFLLLFHNNDGRVGKYDLFRKTWDCNQLNFVRNPMFGAVGTYQPKAHQPIWFGAPKKLLDTDGIPLGPKGTAEIATYTSMTSFKGRQVLWYPDRKYYLLGRIITPEVLG